MRYFRTVKEATEKHGGYLSGTIKLKNNSGAAVKLDKGRLSYHYQALKSIYKLFRLVLA